MGKTWVCIQWRPWSGARRIASDLRIYRDRRNAKSAYPGPTLYRNWGAWPGSALFARCTYTLIRRLKSPSLDSPSICENESCTELEEEMLNKNMCRPCVPLNLMGRCSMRRLFACLNGMYWHWVKMPKYTILHIMSKHWNTCLGDILYV